MKGLPMTEQRAIVKLVFPPKYGERDLGEDRERGYVSHVLAEVGGARLYPVFFYTLDRLGGELRECTRQGEPFIAETGMIVLQDISLEAMQDAVQRLCNIGYFEYMVPITPERLATADPYRWPP
jgi:hypothetical protein